ncbi:MAG: amidohydrolase family protein [Bacteroidetes bacterium]|nr:amidohydrolase family protein [Bacteroidota bacterium]
MNIKPIYMRIISITCLSFMLSLVNAQAPDVPSPGPPQKGKIYLTHATVHTGDGKVLNNATIGFENGKIIFLEENPTFKTDETMGQIIDCAGKHIYPGLIAANTALGLVEIDAVRATVDYAETGDFNPDARAIVAYNTDSRVTPTIRSNGVLFAQTAPLGGWISGTSAIVQLDAWNWEDALMKEDGISMNWPSMFRYKGGAAARYETNKDYDKDIQMLKDYFADAKSYQEAGTHAKTNLRFEAMKGLFTKQLNLYVSVNYVQEILNAIAFAESFNVQVAIVGGKDSYMIADVLAQKKVPVILAPTHQLPTYADEDITQPYKTPAALQKAGVLFCLSIGDGSWPNRNLMFQAGTAVANGLTKEEALAMVTSSVAKIVKLDDRIGTLAKGKDASLIVSTGDVLDMKTSNIELAFISGRKIDLNNKQKALNEKFSKKYGVN